MQSRNLVRVTPSVLAIVWCCIGAQVAAQGHDDASLRDVRPDIKLERPRSVVEMHVGRAVQTALVTHDQGQLAVDFGFDPVRGGGRGAIGASAKPEGGGQGWTLTRDEDPERGGRSYGFNLMWGYWRFLETDRTRSITWGGVNTVGGRLLAAGEGQPERDQIIVLRGKVRVSPVGESDSAPVEARAGQYVTATTVDGKVKIAGPFDLPTGDEREPTGEQQELVKFVEIMREARPEACREP